VAINNQINVFQHDIVSCLVISNDRRIYFSELLEENENIYTDFITFSEYEFHITVLKGTPTKRSTKTRGYA
jgi:hypothetical protein